MHSSTGRLKHALQVPVCRPRAYGCAGEHRHTCMKFSATRSALIIARALPLTVPNSSIAATVAPSGLFQAIWMPGSHAWNLSLIHI